MNATSSRDFVAYYRVSTQRQGQSGLGLDAQQTMAEQHTLARGGRVVACFTEVESGRKSSRPKLAEAVEACKQHGSVLLIATLDRLTRDTVFLAKLREAGVDFVCCDMPEADRFTINIMAAVAEKEAEAISLRTKRALAAKRSQGAVLGGARAPEAYGAVLARGRATTSQAAAEWKTAVAGKARSLRDAGRSLKEIAAILNADGVRTRMGKPLTTTAVYRALDGVTGGAHGRF